MTDHFSVSSASHYSFLPLLLTVPFVLTPVIMSVPFPSPLSFLPCQDCSTPTFPPLISPGQLCPPPSGRFYRPFSAQLNVSPSACWLSFSRCSWEVSVLRANGHPLVWVWPAVPAAQCMHRCHPVQSERSKGRTYVWCISSVALFNRLLL